MSEQRFIWEQHAAVLLRGCHFLLDQVLEQMSMAVRIPFSLKAEQGNGTHFRLLCQPRDCCFLSKHLSSIANRVFLP